MTFVKGRFGHILRLISMLAIIGLVAGCNSHGGSSSGGGSENTNAVSSTNPLDGATGVDVTVTITVTFEQDVIIDNASGVTLSSGSGTVPATVGSSGTDLAIDPAASLAENTTYTVSVAAGAIQGLASAYTFSFTTVNPPPLNSIVSTDPADGAVDVPVTKTLVVTCTENVITGDTSGVTLTGASGDVSVTVTSAGKTLLIDPVPLLEKNSTYTVTIPAGAVQGVASETSVSFTTVQIEFSEQTGIVVSDVSGASIGRSDMSNNIAVSESGIIHVVWKVPDQMVNPPNPGDGIYYSRSTNGGLSFETGVKIRDAAGLPTEANKYVEPEITCSGSDDVYIAYPTAAKQLEVVRSLDSGANWETPIVIGTAGTITEQKHITADGEHVYITTNDGDFPEAASVDNGGNTFIHSADAGVSFDSPVTGLMGYPLHALLVNPLNGDIYITGTEPTGVNEPTPVFYVKSTDHGATFAAPVSSGETITHAGYCFDRQGRIVIVGRTGTLLIGDMNTNTWTKSEVIATASKPLQSTMTVDGDNTIYRVGTSAVDNRIHITYSKDGGLSFSDQDIDAGSYPNAASSVNMTGAAMVYMNAGVVYYAYRNP